MVGMVPTTRWKRINLVFGVSKFLILVEIQPFLTIRGSSFDSCMVMEFGLIASLLGLNMPLLTLKVLELHMMVYIGTHLLQKGANYLYFTVNIFYREQEVKNLKDALRTDHYEAQSWVFINLIYCFSNKRKNVLHIFLS
jgi:hypothetical protein